MIEPSLYAALDASIDEVVADIVEAKERLDAGRDDAGSLPVRLKYLRKLFDALASSRDGIRDADTNLSAMQARHLKWRRLAETARALQLELAEANRQIGPLNDAVTAAQSAAARSERNLGESLQARLHPLATEREKSQLRSRQDKLRAAHEDAIAEVRRTAQVRDEFQRDGMLLVAKLGDANFAERQARLPEEQPTTDRGAFPAFSIR
jgi:hypothetical protein